MDKKSVKNKDSGEGFGVAGFTLSIAGFLSVLFSPLLSILFFIGGIIFCAIQQKKKKTKLAKAGLIVGIIGLVLGIVYTITIAIYIYNQLGGITG